MECRSCDDLRFELDYLEQRNNEYLNKEIEWEIREEKLLTRQGELEDRIADLEEEALKDRDLKRVVEYKLSQYRLARETCPYLHQFSLAEDFINELLALTIGETKTCQFSV